jgi:hypothetical protein
VSPTLLPQAGCQPARRSRLLLLLLLLLLLQRHCLRLPSRMPQTFLTTTGGLAAAGATRRIFPKRRTTRLAYVRCTELWRRLTLRRLLLLLLLLLLRRLPSGLETARKLLLQALCVTRSCPSRLSLQHRLSLLQM